jgi:hypothetical protein
MVFQYERAIFAFYKSLHEYKFLLHISHTSYKLYFKIKTGLAIIRRAVRVFGGRVCTESEGAGKESCFCFSLAHVITN